jgi:cell division protein FtsN
MDLFIIIAILIGSIIGIAVLVYIEEKSKKASRRKSKQALTGVVAPKKTEDSYGPIPTDRPKLRGKK